MCECMKRSKKTQHIFFTAAEVAYEFADIFLCMLGT